MHISISIVTRESSTGAWMANVRNVNFHSGSLGCCASMCWVILFLGEAPLQWCSWEIQEIKTSKTSFHIRNNSVFTITVCTLHTANSGVTEFQETLQSSFLCFCQDMLCILYIVKKQIVLVFYIASTPE